MSDKRNLEFFQANPHELPANLDEIDASVATESGDGDGGEGGTIDAALAAREAEGAPKTGESGAASGAAGPKEGEGAAGDGGKPAVTTPPAEPGAPKVILSKSGKHEIPYSVLETEREQRQAAEATAQRLQEELARLQSQASGGGKPATSTPQTDPPANQPVVDEELLQQIEQDQPEQGKVIRALLGQIGSMREQIETMRGSEAARQQAESRTRADTVQEAIDGNPVLRYLQVKQPEMFSRAVELDKTLRLDPEIRKLPLGERFNKVAEALQVIHGKVEIPAEFAAPAPATPATAGTPAVPAGKAAAPAAATPARPAVATLSEIPGGTPPLADEIEQLGTLSAQELGNRFMSMDPNKVMAILSRAA